MKAALRAIGISTFMALAGLMLAGTVQGQSPEPKPSSDLAHALLQESQRAHPRAGRRPARPHDPGGESRPVAGGLAGQDRHLRRQDAVRRGQGGSELSRRARRIGATVRHQRPRVAAHRSSAQHPAPPCGWSTPSSISRWSIRGSAFPSCSTRKACMAMSPCGATSFPQAIALGSSWDPALVRAVNAVTAREMRARGACRSAHPRGGCGARSALGPHRGNLRRRSVPRRRTGRRGGRRLAGRGQGLPLGARQGFRHAETSDRPRPAGERHQRRARRRISERTLREIFLPAVREDHRSAPASAPSCRPTTRSTACRATPMYWLLQESAARRVGFQGRGGERLLRHRGPAKTCIMCREPDDAMRRSARSRPASTSICPTAEPMRTLTHSGARRHGAEVRASTPRCAACSR